MLPIALRGWYAFGGLSAAEKWLSRWGSGGRVPNGVSRQRRFFRTALKVGVRTLTFSIFHEAFLDELAMAALALGALHVRQQQVGLLAGLPLPLRRQQPVSLQEIERAVAVADDGEAADAQLVRLGDKHILWSGDGQAFLMYARQGGKLVALFDPVGPRDRWNELAGTFRALARRRNCVPVFYQISEDFLTAGAMSGIRGYKLGELAEIPLQSFDMKGGEWANLRRAINRASRDGLVYEFVASDGIPAILGELRAISNAWLAHGGTREKRFSLGAFEDRYIAASPAAVVRLDGRIIAFANLLTTGRGHAFVDLMRFLPGIHRGAMDFLIVRLIEDLKARGFVGLNLGMAPLAGLQRGRGAPLWHNAGGLVARHGNRFYGFQGLYSFKAKFAPEWRSRYIAVPEGVSPYLSATATATLIAGGWSGLFRR